jgi:hypothetical protein
MDFYEFMELEDAQLSDGIMGMEHIHRISRAVFSEAGQKDSVCSESYMA